MPERIVFMGTPQFAAVCLKTLVEAGLDIAAVVTMPDKPIGRGRKTGCSEVKKTALELGLPLLQPEKLKNPDFIAELRALNADLQIVVAFRMLPVQVWSMPRLGTFNLHASLLPAYRGAAPIQRAIWNGEKESGVTTFLLDKDLDTGAILYQEKVAMAPNETAGSLHDKLLEIGAPLVVKTARALFAGSIQARPQEEAGKGSFPEAPKILKEDCYLDFSQPAEKLHRQVMALSPHPGAIALLVHTQKNESTPVKILESEFLQENKKSYEQGRIESDGKHFLHITCGDGCSLAVKKIQLPGKKALTVSEFLRGFRLDSCNHQIFQKVINQ